MIGFCSDTALSARIRMETPAFLFPLFNRFSHFVVITNQYTLPLFQQQSPQNLILEQKNYFGFLNYFEVYVERA